METFGTTDTAIIITLIAIYIIATSWLTANHWTDNERSTAVHANPARPSA